MNQIVILAAGKGTRMNSELPKALVPLKNRPMIHYLLDSVKESGVDDEPIIIVSPDNIDIISESLSEYKVKYILQEKQLGTGHAVSCIRNAIKDETKNIIVLYCDHPFLKSESLKKCSEINIETVLVMPTKLVNFEDWCHNFYHWGRFVRNNNGVISKIVEFKDADLEEQKITEVNPGFMAFNKEWLWQNIDTLNDNNANHEYYLTDLPAISFNQGCEVKSLPINPEEAMGINSLDELAVAEKFL